MAKFIAATHPAYNLMKMPGSSGVLTVAGDTKDELLALMLASRAAAAAWPSKEGAPEAQGAAPAKKKQLFSQDRAETEQVQVDEDRVIGSTFTIGVGLSPKPIRGVDQLPVCEQRCVCMGSQGSGRDPEGDNRTPLEGTTTVHE